MGANIPELVSASEQDEECNTEGEQGDEKFAAKRVEAFAQGSYRRKY